MANTDIVNCYCFNPLCESSIFATKNYTVIYQLLSTVLTAPIYCKSCNSELVSKPVLEIKIQINDCLTKRTPLRAIVINRNPVFHTSITMLLKGISDFDKILHCSNGSDALQYLEKNKRDKKLLPDLILVEGTTACDYVTDFFEGYAKIYPDARKKSSIYITIDSPYNNDLQKTSTYNFVKGTIFGPVRKETLKDITAILNPVFMS